MANEFSESDISDNDFEERETSSEEEYEEADDYALGGNSVTPCTKQSYEEFWTRNGSGTTVEDFQPGTSPIGPLGVFEKEEDAFGAIISPGILNRIVERTNISLQWVQKKLTKDQSEYAKHFLATSQIEVKALIGLWLKLGITGFHQSSTTEIFSLGKSSSLDAHLCFSKHRYEALMRCIRFDDKYKRSRNPDGSWEDKMVHIREVFDIYLRNIKNVYNPRKHLTVDEILLSYRGRCSCRMFIPSKRAKYGIKIFCLVDPATMYLSNASVYFGKQLGHVETNLGENVVMNLASDFLQCKRTIVTDNFFTSSRLGTNLLSKGTHLLGTIRKNRAGNPKDFIAEPLQVGKIQFAFRQKETLMKFQAKKTKQVCLYSTAHRDQQVHRSGKPKMITDYNQTKFAVDIFDKMINRYAYKPSVRCWPLRLFMNFLVDGGAANAYVLFGGRSTRSEFIQNLADQLMDSQKAARATSEHKTTKTFIQISDLYDSLKIRMIQLPKKQAGATSATKWEEGSISGAAANVRNLHVMTTSLCFFCVQSATKLTEMSNCARQSRSRSKAKVTFAGRQARKDAKGARSITV